MESWNKNFTSYVALILVYSKQQTITLTTKGDNMEDRHRRHEKDGSEKDQGAASNDQQQTERRHSSHGKKRHKHRSKKTKTGAGHSPRTHESVENERKAAGTAALSLSANTNVGESNNARQHHDPFAENGKQLLHACTFVSCFEFTVSPLHVHTCHPSNSVLI